MPNIADYVFNNVPAQLTPLQEFLDPITKGELAEIGVPKGGRCLDLGAGGGSVTLLLSELVGPDGLVGAIDQDVHMIPTGPNIEIKVQDMSKGDPLPVEGEFDLIHARLLMHHLPNRVERLNEFASLLKPGGWLLIGDFIRSAWRVLTAPTEQDVDLINRVREGLFLVLEAKDIDLQWGNKMHGVMLDAGLTNVRTRWHVETWTGGTYGCRLLENNIAQKRDDIVALGDVSQEEIDTFMKLLYDPNVVIRSHEFCSVRGQRPTE
jgi:SAM-dependent methyltransferase